MTDPLTLPATARRAVWVFSVDLPEDTLESFPEEDAHGLSPLARAAGTGPLDPDYIELFDAATLCDYGLSNFLIEANGMDAASVTPDADRLDALTGPVALIFSAALPEGENSLSPSAPLHLVGRYVESLPNIAAPCIQSDAAKGVITPAPGPAPRSRAGSLASLALLVLVLGAGLLIWSQL